MGFDGFFLKNVIESFVDDLIGSRIEKIFQIKVGFLFMLYNKGKKNQLILNTLPESSSIFLGTRNYEENKDNKQTNSFCEQISGHIKGSIITNITQYLTDRIIAISIKRNDYLKGVITYNLIFEIFGKKANIILLNKDNIIISILKKDINYLGRTFLTNAQYSYPKTDKLSIPKIIDYSLFQSPNDLMSQYLGISLPLAKYLFFSKKNIFDLEIKATKCLGDYYCCDIFDYESTDTQYFESLSLLLEDISFASKFISENKIVKYIKKQISKSENKINMLQDKLEDDSLLNELTNNANYLLNFPQLYDKHYDTFENISLDIKKTLIENINNMFSKAKKVKLSKEIIRNQIRVEQQKRERLNEILFDYQYISKSDDETIYRELYPYGYFKNHQVKTKKKYKPSYINDSFEGINIYIGKNAFQNETLFKTMNKEYFWFHIKDDQGPHVVYTSSNITDNAIIYCAKLAAQYKTNNTGTKTQVNYTKIKYLKKVSPSATFKLILKEYKTVLID